MNTVTIICCVMLQIIAYQIEYISGTATEHAYRSLETIADEIKGRLRKLMEDSNRKLTEIARIEKDASNSADVLEKECAEMINKVERLAREQVEVSYLSFA